MKKAVVDVKDCVLCVTRTSNPFCELPQAGLDFIDGVKILQKYTRGQTVFYSGNLPTGLYCVSRGLIKVESVDAKGVTHALKLIGAGGTFGYASLFADESYRSSAVAQVDCEICLIPRASLFELCERYPDIAMKFLSRISAELRMAESRMIALTEKTSKARVIEALLFLDQNFQAHRWTRRDVAEWAGTTPETVMRVLSALKDDGLVDTKDHKTVFHDRAKLVALAGLEL